MPALGDPCWRLAGVAYLALPHRVRMPDGSTRTDPAQWALDQGVLDATGWSASTLTQADLDLLYPPPPPPDAFAAGWQTPFGWRLGWQVDDVALLTGLYVLAREAHELGSTDLLTVIDTDGVPHELPFEQLRDLMLGYGAARAALSASTVAPAPDAEPEPEEPLP